MLLVSPSTAPWILGIPGPVVEAHRPPAGRRDPEEIPRETNENTSERKQKTYPVVTQGFHHH